MSTGRRKEVEDDGKKSEGRGVQLNEGKMEAGEKT